MILKRKKKRGRPRIKLTPKQQLKRMLLLLVFFINIGSYQDPIIKVEEINPWKELYPQWDVFTESQKNELINIYSKSSNKYLWFPDSFPDYKSRLELYLIENRYSKRKIKKIFEHGKEDTIK